MHVKTNHIFFAHNITRGHTEQYALHCHTQYECYYFVGGNVRYLVEGVSYTPEPHSILLMARGAFHGIQIVTDMPYERYTLHFDEACLPEAMRARLLTPFHGNSIYYPDTSAYRMSDFFRALEECEAMEEGLREMSMSIRVAALLTQLCEMQNASAMDAYAGNSKAALERQIIAYINDHLTEAISLEALAQQFYISRSQLCRVFAKATGTSVGVYIRQKRLILAQQLRDRGQTAGEAATNAGFSDYSTYYRTVRRMMPDAQAPRDHARSAE